MPAAPRHLFLHHEPSDGAPPYTLKLVTAGAPLTVSDALGRFAAAYGATGHELATAGLQMEDESGKCLRADAVLPCGLSAGADAFVRSDEPPKKLSAEAAPIAAAASAAAVAAAARLTMPSQPAEAPMGEESRQAGVYTRSGSAIAASQAKMGENSYYYSVGKNRAAPAGTAVKAAPAPPSAVAATPSQPMPQAVTSRPAKLPEQTFSSHSWLDDEDSGVKVHINLAGASNLPAGAVVCIFRERSFDLKVTLASEHKLLRLHIPILGELIDADKCVVKKKSGKLIVVLAKHDKEKSWYELRKTKGVGDTEYTKIVPDFGDEHEFVL